MSRLFGSSSGSVLGTAGSKMSSFRKVTHCIFDMDGLLLGKCAWTRRGTEGVVPVFVSVAPFRPGLLGLLGLVLGAACACCVLCCVAAAAAFVLQYMQEHRGVQCQVYLVDGFAV